MKPNDSDHAPEKGGAAGATGAVDSEILRIIGNARSEHNVCVMARGRYGLAEFGRLAGLLKDVPDGDLARYVDLVEDVRRSHDCFRCSMKFLAFNALVCAGRLRERANFFRTYYHHRMEGCGLDRDFMQEVAQVIWEAEHPPVRRRAELPPLDGD